MKMSRALAFLISLTLIASGSTIANSTYGTKEEAKAMAEKAAALVKANPEEAFKKFNDKDGGFVDRDLYVFVVDSKNITKAHGGKPILVGKDTSAMKDVKGFAFVKAFLEVKDAGWVDYQWPDPADSNKIKDKSTYVVKVGDYAVGVGYFKN